MEIMAADGIAETFSAVKDALDIRTHTVGHPRRNRIHIPYNFAPLWPCLSFYNLPFFLLFFKHCVSDSVSSRSLSKPTPCRQRGPPQSQVRGPEVSLSPFCRAASHHLLSTGWFFTGFPLSGSQWTLTLSGQREKREEKCTWVVCFFLNDLQFQSLWWFWWLRTKQGR